MPRYLQMLLKGVASCHTSNIVQRVSQCGLEGLGACPWRKYGQRGPGLRLGPGEGGAWAELGAQFDIPFQAEALWGLLGN